MTLTYEDSLQQVLDAVRAGEDLEVALARFPEHAAALRENVHLSEGVTQLASYVPPPRPEARADAARRMLTEVAAGRAASTKPRWSAGGLWMPRYVLAAAVVAIAVLGAGLLLDGGGATVEAATIEGVVVDNSDGMLTVQTLDTLERVKVPADTLVSDVAGVSIGLGGIEVGQVVVVDVQRRGKEVVAQRIQRYVESIEAWCTDDSARCQVLSQGLEQAKHQCERSPQACRFALERLEQLRLRASDSARLEELRQHCRSGEAGACRQLVTFCRERLEVCGGLAPDAVPNTDLQGVGSRLRVLLQSCLVGEEAACRKLAQACNQYANLCPVDLPLRPEPSPTTAIRPIEVAPGVSRASSAPAAAVDARPSSTATAPTVQPIASPDTSNDRPELSPPRDAAPTAAAERDAEPPVLVRGTAIDAATPEPTTASQPGDTRSGDAPSER